MKKLFKNNGQDTQLTKRIKTVLWGLLSLLVVTTASYFIEVVPTLGLSEIISTTIVLILSQVTKYLNTK